MSAIPSGTGTTGATQPATVSNPSLNMTATDFLQMMVTQLQNQDPLQPTDSSQLLSQMSQIGQLQASTSLQSTLSSLAQQNQIGAASALIGKYVQGNDANNAAVSGTVNSIQVSTSGVTLQLSSGSSLSLGNVSSISAPPAATTGNSSTGTTPTTGS